MSGRVCPWSSWAEWGTVRDCLLGDDATAAAVALDRVVAWRRRGRLPLGVDISTSLVRTCLRDPVAPRQHLRPQRGNAAAEASLQSEYSLTLIRFVNGVSDSIQKGKVATSVAKHAEFAGLHPMLVDVRHEATHNNLPSLHTLRLAAAHALAWLQLNYWQAQSERLAECNADAVGIVLKLVETQTARLAISGKQGGDCSSGSGSDESAEVHVGVMACGDAPSAAVLKKQQRSLLGDLKQVVPASQPTILAAAVSSCDVLHSQQLAPSPAVSPSPQKKQMRKGGKKRKASCPAATRSQMRPALASTLAVLDTVWSCATRFIVKECVNSLSDIKRVLLSRASDAVQQSEASYTVPSSAHAAMAWLSAALTTCRDGVESSCAQQVAQYALQHLLHLSLLLRPATTLQFLHQAPEKATESALLANLSAFYCTTALQQQDKGVNGSNKKRSAHHSAVFNCASFACRIAVLLRFVFRNEMFQRVLFLTRSSAL